jgi:hypothetical protein
MQYKLFLVAFVLGKLAATQRYIARQWPDQEQQEVSVFAMTYGAGKQFRLLVRLREAVRMDRRLYIRIAVNLRRDFCRV